MKTEIKNIIESIDFSEIENNRMIEVNEAIKLLYTLDKYTNTINTINNTVNNIFVYVQLKAIVNNDITLQNSLKEKKQRILNFLLK